MRVMQSHNSHQSGAQGVILLQGSSAARASQAERASQPVGWVDDVEGDLLSHVRRHVGEGVPIGAELDLHCHLTKRMTSEATALVLYKPAPHERTCVGPFKSTSADSNPQSKT
jgi:hypothetical protein